MFLTIFYNGYFSYSRWVTNFLVILRYWDIMELLTNIKNILHNILELSLPSDSTRRFEK